MSPTEPRPLPERGLIRRTLRNRWLSILTVWVVGSVMLAVAVSASIRPVYRASSLLRVDPAGPDLYGVKGGEQPDTFLQTQVQLITSPNVLATAGANPRATALPRIQAAGDVVLELRRVIGVGVIGGTSLIEVSMASQSPHEAATLVNAVVDAFMASHNEWAEGMTRNQVKILEDYMADLRVKSDDVERRWRELASRGDAQVFVKGQDGRAEITPERYERLRDALFDVNLELAIAQAWASDVKTAASNAEKNPASPADEAMLAQRVERRLRVDPEMVELASAMRDAATKLDEIRRMVRTPEDPAERNALNKLESIQARHEKLGEDKRRQIREDILADNKKPDAELHEAEAKVRALSVRQRILKDQVDQLEVRDRRRATDEVGLMLLRDQYESLKAMREQVARRLEQLSFERRGDARVRVVNPATPPGSPIGDRRISRIVTIPFLMLPIAFAFFLGLEVISPSSVPTSPVTVKEAPPAEV